MLGGHDEGVYAIDCGLCVGLAGGWTLLNKQCPQGIEGLALKNTLFFDSNFRNQAG